MAVTVSGKLALFIDGASLYATAKALGFDIDFKRLLSEFASRGTLVRAYYYTTIMEGNEFQAMRPLTDWLDFNGFAVKSKPAKEYDDGLGRRKIKRNIGVELSVDALEISGYVDRVLLFSGDGDFRRLVEAIQRRGPVVTVVSSIRTNPAMIASDLRRQADEFIELDTLRDCIGRTLPSLAAQ
jgi:uncharacterized LabA/DUF88 family protein